MTAAAAAVPRLQLKLQSWEGSFAPPHMFARRNFEKRLTLEQDQVAQQNVPTASSLIMPSETMVSPRERSSITEFERVFARRLVPDAETAASAAAHASSPRTVVHARTRGARAADLSPRHIDDHFEGGSRMGLREGTRMGWWESTGQAPWRLEERNLLNRRFLLGTGQQQNRDWLGMRDRERLSLRRAVRRGEDRD